MIRNEQYLGKDDFFAVDICVALEQIGTAAIKRVSGENTNNTIAG